MTAKLTFDWLISLAMWPKMTSDWVVMNFISSVRVVSHCLLLTSCSCSCQLSLFLPPCQLPFCLPDSCRFVFLSAVISSSRQLSFCVPVIWILIFMSAVSLSPCQLSILHFSSVVLFSTYLSFYLLVSHHFVSLWALVCSFAFSFYQLSFYLRVSCRCIWKCPLFCIPCRHELLAMTEHRQVGTADYDRTNDRTSAGGNCKL